MRENLLEPACTWCHMDMVGLELESCLAVTSPVQTAEGAGVLQALPAATLRQTGGGEFAAAIAQISKWHHMLWSACPLDVTA